jgi:hypothetical protein
LPTCNASQPGIILHRNHTQGVFERIHHYNGRTGFSR